MRVARAARLARTARRLRVSQMLMRPYARFATTALPRVTWERPVDSQSIDRFRAWTDNTAAWSKDRAVAEARDALRGEWNYIGKQIAASPGPGSFPSSFPSRLWEYEFRYRRWLEGLAHLAGRNEVARELVTSMWDRADREEARADYEPYVLARRLWSEATAAGLMGDESRLGRIDREVRILRMMPELHILANHLLADRATVAALSALLHPSASSTAKAFDDYIEELERQIDRDGLHEERSPGYHLIALHDLERTVAAAEVAGLHRVAGRLASFGKSMSGVLARLIHPDGTMPMFHDSPALASPSPSDLAVRPDSASASFDLPASGFSIIQGVVDGSQMRVVCDFGGPRPEHQPGHQHAAPFAFELWWDGLWITSAGVSTYAPGARRLFERSAAAHACVRVGEREPAEIWSAFRMGGGYDVTSRRFVDSGSSTSITGSHDGYAPAIHRRTIEFDRRALRVTVSDEVTGIRDEKVESFLPIAPGVSASLSGETATLVRGRKMIDVRVAGARLELRLLDVSLRFGEPQKSHVIVATATGSDGLLSKHFSFRSVS